MSTVFIHHNHHHLHLHQIYKTINSLLQMGLLISCHRWTAAPEGNEAGFVERKWKGLIARKNNSSSRIYSQGQTDMKAIQYSHLPPQPCIILVACFPQSYSSSSSSSSYSRRRLLRCLWPAFPNISRTIFRSS